MTEQQTTETTEQPILTKDYLLSLPYGDFVNTLARDSHVIMSELTHTKINLLHGAFGLATEMLELIQAKGHILRGQPDRVNIIEEGGDCTFYHRLIFNNLGVDTLPDPVVHTPDMSICALIDALCCYGEQAIDKVKRHVFYSATIETDTILQSLSNSLEILRRLAYAVGGFKLEAMVDANRLKLASRYEGGYTNAKAINRDLVEERKLLETSAGS